MIEYLVVNERTGEPVHAGLGEKLTYESKLSAEAKANFLTTGNEDDFTVEEA